MTVSRITFLNTGIYSLPEASRLTKVSKGKIRRWIKGYDYRVGSARRHSDAVWHGGLEPIDGKVALGFLDLVEIRFVEEFLRVGVSWKTMRQAHARAKQELGTEHPFCSNRIVTDGQKILFFQANESSDKVLLDLLSNQQEFLRIVEPFLKELEFSEDQLARWWPLGKDRSVVVDPSRNFGQPTTSKSGVPTQVIARSLKANESVEAVARWYEVLPEEVRDAVTFEDSLAA
jgi:uncharacterized protein (DUF433 family)